MLLVDPQRGARAAPLPLRAGAGQGGHQRDQLALDLDRVVDQRPVRVAGGGLGTAGPGAVGDRVAARQRCHGQCAEQHGAA